MKRKLMLVLLSSLLFAGCGNKIPASDLVLSASSFSINVGEQKQITAEVKPDDATDKTIVWSVVSGSEYATVDSNGLVYGVSEGTAIVAATSNNITKACTVTVTNPVHEILPESVSVDEKVNIVNGESKQLTATVLPANATNKSVSWSVLTGSDCISITETGLVTTHKVGTAVVQAKTVNSKTALCEINVLANEILPTNVLLNTNNVVMKDNETKTLTATVLPDSATDKTVTWSVTSGDDVVSINQSGLITPIKAGSAVVQVKTINDKVATCNVTVNPSVINPTDISLSENTVSIVNGESKQLTATVLPQDATDKTVTWSVTSGDNVISVDSTGLITTLKVGTAVVEAKTVNGLTSICNVSVVANEILPTSVTIDPTATLKVNETVTLTATVLPDDATDKSVTWSVIAGDDCVSVLNGVVTGLKAGTAKVQASTSNNKTSFCDVTVLERTLKGYINNDRHELIDGNPFEKVGAGDFVEITNRTVEQGIPVYEFTMGAIVRFKLKENGYFVPTGLKINGEFHAISGEYVTFEATVEDPDDPNFNFFDIEVEFKNDTPKIGDYEISLTPSSHIDLIFKYEENGQETRACSQGDMIIVIPQISDADYDVKTITGYTYTTDDTIQHKSYFDINKMNNGQYYFITPFSHESCKTIWIQVEEINTTAFKEHEALGEYVVLRTFGTPSNSNINAFQNAFTISFDASGLISYKSDNSEKSAYEAYASSSEKGVLHAMFGTSSFDAYYGKNIIILGMNSSGGSMITPLSSGADIAIGVKLASGMVVSNISIDNHVVKINNETYATFTFFYNDQIYASCFMDINAKSITTNTNVKKYSCGKLSDLKSVYEVFDSEENSLIHVGYQNEGGEGEYKLITTRDNGYVDATHSLVFINDDQAVFDNETYKILDVDTNKITLSIPTHEFDITLDPSSHTFVVTGDREITPKTLDIADKRFIATIYNSWDEKYCDCEVVFGESNTNITGVIRFDLKAQNVFYWTFTAVFDSTTDILTITITDRGYNGATSNFDNSLGRTVRILVEDGQITFKDQVSTQSNVYDFKNKTFSCDDFHF